MYHNVVLSRLLQYSDLNQLKEGMDGLRNGIAQKLQDGAKKLQDGARVIQDQARVIGDNIALEKFNLLQREENGGKKVPET